MYNAMYNVFYVHCVYPFVLQFHAVVGVLTEDTDPMVSVMKLEKAPDETYADIGGLDQQIQEIKVWYTVIELVDSISRGPGWSGCAHVCNTLSPGQLLSLQTTLPSCLISYPVNTKNSIRKLEGI